MTLSIINLLVTDQTFFKKDAILMFYCGIFYIFVNLWGTIIDNKPVYDISFGYFDWTWKNPIETFYTYFL